MRDSLPRGMREKLKLKFKINTLVSIDQIPLICLENYIKINISKKYIQCSVNVRCQNVISLFIYGIY